MVNQKFDLIVIGEVRAFLKLQWPYSKIIDHFDQKGIKISIGYLSKLNNNQENSPGEQRVFVKTGPSQVLSERQNSLIVRQITEINPPSQSVIASELGVSRQLINLQIKRNGLKRLKKPKVHLINEATQEKRRKRAWPLYHLLKNDQWKKIVTVDEALFSVKAEGIQTEYQYIQIDTNRNQLSSRETQNFRQSLMVFVDISFAGVTKPIFVEPGANISSDYYINKVLKPFLRDVQTRLYPDGQ